MFTQDRKSVAVYIMTECNVQLDFLPTITANPLWH